MRRFFRPRVSLAGFLLQSLHRRTKQYCARNRPLVRRDTSQTRKVAARKIACGPDRILYTECWMIDGELLDERRRRLEVEQFDETGSPG